MNEKFKKDEVRGYLGKANQKDKAGRIKNHVSDQRLVDKQGVVVYCPNLIREYFCMLYVRVSFFYSSFLVRIEVTACVTTVISS